MYIGWSHVRQVPQLIENYQSQSAEGISLAFLAVWFVGDLSNLFGALWAGLVPTVVALALYFCLADAVLIGQCLYYNNINARTKRAQVSVSSNPEDPNQPLLQQTASGISLPGSRRRSSTSQRRRNSSLVSPTLPVIPEHTRISRLWIKNAISIILVCCAGAAGWAISWKSGLWNPEPDGRNNDVAVGAEVLGYLSAAAYLGYGLWTILLWKDCLYVTFTVLGYPR